MKVSWKRFPSLQDLGGMQDDQNLTIELFGTGSPWYCGSLTPLGNIKKVHQSFRKEETFR